MAPKARPNAHKPILWGQYGDGRVRGESMEAVPTTKQQTSLTNDKTELNIGRKRAEEWVANTAGATESGIGEGVGNPGGDVGMANDGGQASSPDAGTGGGRVSGARSHSSQGNASEDDEMKAEARRRRALVHGFTDYKAPSEW